MILLNKNSPDLLSSLVLISKHDFWKRLCKHEITPNLCCLADFFKIHSKPKVRVCSQIVKQSKIALQTGHSLAPLQTQRNTMYQLLGGKPWDFQSLPCARLKWLLYLFFREENDVSVQRAIAINCRSFSETVYLVKLVKQELVYEKLEQ